MIPGISSTNFGECENKKEKAANVPVTFRKIFHVRDLHRTVHVFKFCHALLLKYQECCHEYFKTLRKFRNTKVW